MYPVIVLTLAVSVMHGGEVLIAVCLYVVTTRSTYWVHLVSHMPAYWWNVTLWSMLKCNF